MAGANITGTIAPFSAFTLIFNLVVGIGSMTLPSHFYEAGLVLSIVLISFLSIISYISASYVVEAMSICNALSLFEKKETTSSINSETTALIEHMSSDANNSDEIMNLDNEKHNNPYDLHERIEYSKMAKLLYSKNFQIFHSIIFILYFLGDLAIYSVGAPRSFKTWDCFKEFTLFGMEFAGMGATRVLLCVFACIVLPLAMYDMSNIRIIQWITLVLRIVAFFTMVVLGLNHFFGLKSTNTFHWNDIPQINISSIPLLLGPMVYSFMSHHSLPSMLTPVEKSPKKGKTIRKLVIGDFVLITVSYLLLSSSALLAFSDPTLPDVCPMTSGVACKIQELYFQNFASYSIRPIAFFLETFPIIVFTTVWPLIAITLKSNINQLLPDLGKWENNRSKIVFLLAVIPPLTVGLFTDDVGSLVTISGGFCGVFIQFIFPALFVRRARKLAEEVHILKDSKNSYQSPFQSDFWCKFVLAFSALIIVSQIYRFIHG
eukprot:TRINITY_DN3256_c1_g3_i1.p1 TRINITY_DN3256_c1_g3~~TRINITY_DN3256_c1_g3_i1.p1  ORF type:complete len:489 (+),score=94.70 TRINITY_DN3256_c1_g3_i1:27-1493(+)